jgi:flagellar biosynthetic protein FliP
MPQLTLSLADVQGPEQVVPALKILLLFTILSIAPAILISMTSFTRIVIVLSFLRQALGAQNVPPTQVVMALSLILTGVVMTPVAQRLDTEAFEPYQQKELNEKQAFDRAAVVARDFLIPQTREADLKLFYELNHTPLPKTQDEVGLHLLVPAFMISELRTAFEMGFLIFLPFVLIDIVVASILTAMGMVMLPPTMLATPLKLLLFVVVDGWALLSRSLIASFH